MRKKLIEVALPLEAINLESAREKSIRHGHPSTLHLWWARRPLAACRAVLWASLVDDPSSWPDKFPTEEDQKQERQRLFDILGRITIETDRNGNTKQVVRGLVSWDDVNDPNSGVLEAAQREIARCLAWNRGEEPPTKPEAVREYIAKYAPPAYDPFAGGGSIPLEAQRLGLEAHASDLNPVAVLINKALIEIPPKFKDQAPVNPEDRAKKNMSSWRGAQGLAADVRFYGAWMRDRAFERIGHLYPKVELPQEYGGGEATVIAWLWARTVKCPNPACGCAMPLVRSFQLSTKKGKEAWVEPIVENHTIRFGVKSGEGKAPEGTVDRKGARCIACETPVPLEYIRQEGRAGRMGQQLMAIVAEGQNGRVYLAPTAEQEAIANSAQSQWKPDADLPHNPRNFNTPNYGMGKFSDLFTPRQLVALTTFSDLVGEARGKTTQDAVAAGLSDDDVPLNDGGTGARAYGEAIATYLGMALSKLADASTSLVRWKPSMDQAIATFGRQALPMVWDYAESNIFNGAAGDYLTTLKNMLRVVQERVTNNQGQVSQHDATAPHPHDTTPKLISTDPPYCLAPDTLIQTAKGYVPIQDIQIGDQVLTHKGQFSPVINTSKRWYEGDICHLTIAGVNHPLMITGEHPIYGIKTNPCGYHFSYCHPDCSYIKSQGRCRHQAFADYQLDWIPASETKPYDLIFIPTLTTNEFQRSINLQEYLPQGDYLERDGLLHYQKATTKSLHHREQQTATLCRDRQYTIPAHLKITPAFCRLIGFFIAEGYARLESGSIYPNICSTLLVPKAQELVSTPYRFEGSKQKAKDFFESGIRQAFSRMRAVTHDAYPVTIFYAFKQQEEEGKKGEEVIASTGWETMLEGLLQSNLTINGTWPMRSEMGNRMVASGTNALASSIVLVCCPRPTNAPKITRRQFLTELKRQLPPALKTLQQGNVAPVDLAQASIGPGMAVFSQYAAVLENDGSPMRVRTALQLINQILDEFLTEQEGEFDGDTRWALTWFEQYQFEPGQYGDAETLSKAKNTSVQGMVEAGILEAKGGKVRLLKRSELKPDWDPNSDSRMPDWEIAQYLIHELDQKGEMGAAALLAKLGSRGEMARDLAYRLYSLCDRKGWTQEAIVYNSLVISWPEISRLASELNSNKPIQTSLL